MKAEIAPLQFGDAQIGTVVKDYYRDNSFCRMQMVISTVETIQPPQGANKNTYIDSFPDRNVNAFLYRSSSLCYSGKVNNWFLN
jgi:hypothetical protein